MFTYTFKAIWILLLLALILVASVKVYPEEMKAIESKVWISIVTPIEDWILEMQKKMNKARNKDEQRDIEDIVNDEIVQ